MLKSECTVKVRQVGDARKWEDIEPIAVVDSESEAIDVIAEVKCHPKVREVRMNHTGSQQGYYFPNPNRLAAIGKTR